MSKVDDELTRRLRRAELPVDGDGGVRGPRAQALAPRTGSSCANGTACVRGARRHRRRLRGPPRRLRHCRAQRRAMNRRQLSPTARSCSLAGCRRVGCISSPSNRTASANGRSRRGATNDPNPRRPRRSDDRGRALDPGFADMDAEGSSRRSRWTEVEPTWITDPLPTGRRSAWSPDGTQIAFADIETGRPPSGISVDERRRVETCRLVVADSMAVARSRPGLVTRRQKLVFVGAAGATSEAELGYSDLYMVGVDGPG